MRHAFQADGTSVPLDAPDPRFICDVHLGRLASYLRILGYDTAYSPAFDDPALLSQSNNEHRILLSRDRRLVDRAGPLRARYVQSTNPREQFQEISRRFDLARSAKPFSRCLRCNALLSAVSKEGILERLPPYVSAVFEEFLQCPVCSRVYWKGSHFKRMEEFLRRVLPEIPPL